jgi:hypothetical protein
VVHRDCELWSPQLLRRSVETGRGPGMTAIVPVVPIPLSPASFLGALLGFGSGTIYAVALALRSSAPRSMEAANGPACHGEGHAARRSGSLRGRGATPALLERIDMRNVFSAYRDRPACHLVADPCLRPEPARGLPPDQGLRLVDSRERASHNATIQQASSRALENPAKPVIVSGL